jgi:hypothetical protein
MASHPITAMAVDTRTTPIIIAPGVMEIGVTKAAEIAGIAAVMAVGAIAGITDFTHNRPSQRLIL